MNDKLIMLPDSDFIAELAESLKPEDSKPDILYVDGHIDLPYFMKKNAEGKTFDNLDKGPVTPETLINSGVRLFAAAIYCRDIFNGEGALHHFHQNYDFTRKIFENMLHVKSSSDIRKLEDSEDAIGMVFLLENADVLAGNHGLSMSLREKGIYIVGLTHTGTNRLADGNSVMHSKGITPEGREVVHVLQDNNILIDVAHLHPSCFWQLMDLIETPCVSSHTGIRERCNLPRNLDMDQMRQIVERGGLAGIAFNPGMLSLDGKADIEDIFIHIDTVVQKFGPDHVALGSDFCGFNIFAQGMEDFSGLNALKNFMTGHGYSNDDLNKILGLNWLGIYESLL